MKFLKGCLLPGLLALCLLLSGCAGTVGASSPVSYDASAGSYTVAGRSWANLFEWSASPDGNYLVYVASSLNEEPEAWLYDRAADTHRQLTDNGYFIESQACVNDGGNWALVLTETSNARSSLLYNGGTVTNNQLLNRSPCFWKDKLFYAVWDSTARSTALFLYDPETEETETLASGLPLSTGLSTAAEDAILLEAYDGNARANTVLAVRPEAEEAGRIETLSGGDSFLLPSDAEPRILQVSGDDNAKYLFNAYYWLNKYQSGEPWSGSPDSAGRVSWNESYRLLGLEELQEKTKDKTIRARISAAVSRLISTREAAYQASGQEQDRFLFVTRKYSLDQQSELRLMVNNSMIYWPMLTAANNGYLEETDRQTLLSMAEAAFRYYEEDWDSENQHYRFRRGTPFSEDGVKMPFNQQNAFGLCLIELWKATGNPVYRERCAALARTFAKEIVCTGDGRTIWRYWPQEYYNGWTKADGVSQNRPSRLPDPDPPYEDISHAALNAAFILEYSRTFGDVFMQAQIQGLRRTLDAIYTDEGTSQTLEPVEITNRYHNGCWAVLLETGDQANAFARCTLQTDTFDTVEFDEQDLLYASTRLYDPSKGGSLQISTYIYSSGASRRVGERIVTAERIPDLTTCLRTIPAI